MENNYSIMSYRQDLPGFGEPMEGMWDGFQRINTETKSEQGLALLEDLKIVHPGTEDTMLDRLASVRWVCVPDHVPVLQLWLVTVVVLKLSC